MYDYVSEKFPAETLEIGSRLTFTNCKYNTTDLLIPGGEYSKQYTQDEMMDYGSVDCSFSLA
jgi:hypothetical protein